MNCVFAFGTSVVLRVHGICKPDVIWHLQSLRPTSALNPLPESELLHVHCLPHHHLTHLANGLHWCRRKVRPPESIPCISPTRTSFTSGSVSVRRLAGAVIGSQGPLPADAVLVYSTVQMSSSSHLNPAPYSHRLNQLRLSRRSV